MQKPIEDTAYFFKFIPVSLQYKPKRPKYKLQLSKNVEIKFVLYLGIFIST
jgi:hypothetical protein